MRKVVFALLPFVALACVADTQDTENESVTQAQMSARADGHECVSPALICELACAGLPTGHLMVPGCPVPGCYCGPTVSNCPDPHEWIAAVCAGADWAWPAADECGEAPELVCDHDSAD